MLWVQGEEGFGGPGPRCGALSAALKCVPRNKAGREPPAQGALLNASCYQGLTKPRVFFFFEGLFAPSGVSTGKF